VCLHCCLCDDEGLRDLAVREATPHEGEDLEFALGQVDEVLAPSVVGGRAAAELLDQSACDRRSDEYVSLDRLPDCVGQLSSPDILQQEAAAPDFIAS
jgi:hypothetical protein